MPTPQTPRPEPRRVRVEGDLYHGRVPEGAVYVGRAAPGLPASPYANPHRLGKPCAVPECAGAVHTREVAVSRYREDLRHRPDLVDGIRREITGRDVACWCKADEVCHGDVVLQPSCRTRRGSAIVVLGPYLVPRQPPRVASPTIQPTKKP
jgi:hypothetical protein